MIHRFAASRCANVYNVAVVLLMGLLVGCTTSSELEWNDESAYRWAEVAPGYLGETGFESLAPSQTGINFQNQITSEQIADNRHYLNGSGVAAGDIDGDGLTDLYFTGLNTGNKLYRNVGGMQFEDITGTASVAHEDYFSTGAVFADIDGDGDLDLLVTAMHKQNVLYINDGTGNFTRKENSGLGPANGSMTMALADIDGDQDLDLYIANYKEKSVKDMYTTEELEWNNILEEPYNEQNQTGPFTLVEPFDEHYRLFMTNDNRLAGAAETGKKDELYINEGEGTFRKVTDTEQVFLDQQGQPLGLQPDWGLTAKFQDLNNDGYPDLYVCNDFFPQDRVWINQGNGTFRAIGWSAIRNMSFSSMAVDFSDINRDGELDMFVTEMLSPLHERRLRQMGSDDPTPDRTDQLKARPQYNRNSMYLKREDSTYAEIAYYSDTEATEWSWATRFMDINLDGYEDLIVNTGYTYDILDIDTQAGMIQEGRNMDENFDVLVDRAPPLHLKNKFLQNNGDLSFRDRSTEWGFSEEDVSHGLATADLDNDGDLDFVSNRLNKTATVFENKTNAPRIAVRLQGEKPNTQGIGAKVSLESDSMKQQKQLSSGGDYLSGSTPLAMFAAETEEEYTIRVTWPDGDLSRVENVQANRIYEIKETEAQEVSNTDITKVADYSPIFEDVSHRIEHTHHEDPFDDSNLQPLLPAKLSQFGPGVTWIDIDRDGDDDLLIASGKGGTIGAFENRGDGSFSEMDQSPFEKTAPGDQTAIIGWGTEQGTNLLVGSANYEQGNPQVPSAFGYRFENAQSQQMGTLSNYSTTGPLSAADYDNDGDVDLFLGGRFVPAHYPRNATSRLFKNENGFFRLDEVNSRKLGEIGLITGSTFTDYDQDGDQDLLLSREWDSILLMENDGGVFNNIAKQVGLAGFKGWWSGITTGDFNNDGRPDIVVANWGLNSSYQLEYGEPIRMYYDDFNGDRRVDIIEAYANRNNNYVPRKKMYEYNSLPVISNRVNSYEEFGESTLQDFFGNRLSRIPFKEINTLKHMLFLSSEEGFKAHPLPPAVQFSAGFHVGVADVNNDGNEDLFMSQNFFGVPRQVPRLDAGRGLLLQGDGTGNFSVIPGSRSGIKVYGEQRGAAFADFNRDGKVDLAVSQNENKTKLYVNQITREGYHVTLKGPSENSNGVGSAVRLNYHDSGKGPLREIQSGSGYWSQSSYTQVLGVKQGATVESIQVHWFDGRRQTVDVTEGKRNYIIEFPDEEG